MAFQEDNQLAKIVERVTVDRAERHAAGTALSGQVRTFGGMDLYQFKVVNLSASGVLLHCSHARVLPLAKDTLVELQIAHELPSKPIYIIGKVMRRDPELRTIAVKILPQSAVQRDAWHELILDWAPPLAHAGLTPA